MSFYCPDLFSDNGSRRRVASLRSARWPVAGSVTSVCTSGGYAYVTAGDGHVRAIGIANGAVKWSYRAGGPVNSGIAVANGVTYFGCDDWRVYAVYASTGHLKWTYRTRGAVECGLAVYQDRVLAGSNDGTLYALQT